MARRKDNRGRVTPKGTKPGDPVRLDDEGHPVPPPAPRFEATARGSSMIPVIMGVLLAIGSLIIIVNYLGWLPGGSDNAWLGVGLLFVLGGVIAATRWE